MIAIIDYGAGNIQSVNKALKYIGCDCVWLPEVKNLEDYAGLKGKACRLYTSWLARVSEMQKADENKGKTRNAEAVFAATVSYTHLTQKV